MASFSRASIPKCASPTSTPLAKPSANSPGKDASWHYHHVAAVRPACRGAGASPPGGFFALLTEAWWLCVSRFSLQVRAIYLSLDLTPRRGVHPYQAILDPNQRKKAEQLRC